MCNDVIITIYREGSCPQSHTSKKSWDLNLDLFAFEVYPAPLCALYSSPGMPSSQAWDVWHNDTRGYALNSEYLW